MIDEFVYNLLKEFLLNFNKEIVIVLNRKGRIEEVLIEKKEFVEFENQDFFFKKAVLIFIRLFFVLYFLMFDFFMFIMKKYDYVMIIFFKIEEVIIVFWGS